MTQQNLFYIIVLVCGFIATLGIRTLAMKLGIVNKPNPIIPQHVKPVAYLGGIGIFGGIAIGLVVCYFYQNELFNQLILSLKSYLALAIGAWNAIGIASYLA
ncbi:MAG: hypothetical protein ABI921_14740, partial [Panacibacter sp.]